MKKLLFTTTILLSSITSYAEEMASCETIEQMASVTMMARQGGVPMKTVYDAAKDSKFAQKMVIEAYETPQYNTTEYKERAQQKFADKYYMKCIKSQF